MFARRNSEFDISVIKQYDLEIGFLRFHRVAPPADDEASLCTFGHLREFESRRPVALVGHGHRLATIEHDLLEEAVGAQLRSGAPREAVEVDGELRAGPARRRTFPGTAQLLMSAFEG